MADNYRITIRTDRETADAFRDLAIDEELSLGEMLSSMVNDWIEDNVKLDETDDYFEKELAKLYSSI